MWLDVGDLPSETCIIEPLLERAGLTKRIASLVELGVAAAGLAVYLAVLGGLQQWVKLEAAGLPGDVAISGYDPTALAASGARALVVLPIAFCILLVLVRVLEDERPAAQRGVVARAWESLPDFLLQILVLLAGLLIGSTVTSGLASVASPASTPLWSRILELALLDGFVVLVALVPALVFVLGRAGWRHLRMRGGAARARSVVGRERVAERPEEPRALAWARRQTSALRKPRRLLAAVIALIVNLLASGTFVVLALDHGDDHGGVLLVIVALAVVCLPYLLLTLCASAAIMHTATRAGESGAVDESAVVLGAIVLASLFLPLWAGAYVVAIFLLVFLAGQAPLAPGFVAEESRWLPSSVAARALIVSMVIAACTLVLQTHQPQRFARATFPVGVSLTADAALLGHADGQLLLGVCHRQRDGTSTAVELIRVPEDRVPAYRIVDDGYTFYRDDEPTLLSGILDAWGLPAYRPPTFIAPSRSPPRHVCGPTPADAARAFDRLRLYEPPTTK